MKTKNSVNLMRTHRLPTILLLIAAISQPVFAEEIRIGISKQSPDIQHIERPHRGMNAEAVIARYGEPSSQTPPKGQPPISTWHYPQFSVYFESGIVIHSVLKHSPKHSQP